MSNYFNKDGELKSQDTVKLVGIISKIYKDDDNFNIFNIVITTMKKRANSKKEGIINNFMCRFEGSLGSIKIGDSVRVFCKLVGDSYTISENLKTLVVIYKIKPLKVDLGYTIKEIDEYLKEYELREKTLS